MIGNRRGSRRTSDEAARWLLVVLTVFGVASRSFAAERSRPEMGGCHDRDYSGYRYTVTSPNYPEAYPENTSCLYRLRGSPLPRCNETLEVEFLDFSLPPSENCLGDSLRIGEGRGVSLCGRVVGTRRYSSGESGVLARFRSGSREGTNPGRDAGPRFKIVVTALPCTSSAPTDRLEKARAFSSINKSSPARVESLAENKDEDDDELAARVEIVPTVFESKSGASIESLKVVGRKASVAPPANEILPPSRDGATLFRGTSSIVSTRNSSTERATAPPTTTAGFRHDIENNRPEKLVRGSCCRDASEYQGPLYDSTRGGETFDATANFRQRFAPPIFSPTVSSILDHSSNADISGKVYYPISSYGVPPPAARGTESCSLPTIDLVPPKIAVYQRPRLPNYFNPNVANSGKLCCNSYFSGLRFVLASPGFPSVSHDAAAYECVYSIIPYSLDVCRMRFNFKYFNHGTEDLSGDGSCNNGYVEIDGRRLCGCKRGLSVSSIVTSAFPKIIPVRYTGYPRSKFSGFLVEVVQERCSNGAVTAAFSELSRRRRNDNDSDATSERGDASSRTKRNSVYGYPGVKIGTSLVESWRETSPDRPSSSLLLTCQTLSLIDWTIAAKEAYLRNARCARTNPLTPEYPGHRPNDRINWGATGLNVYREYPWREGGLVTPEHRGKVGSVPLSIDSPISPPTDFFKFPSTRCEEVEVEDVNVSEGIVSSPGYPDEYPNNIVKCFRFHKAPDTCRFELAILDFDVENSAGCTKDYVTLGERNVARYCGKSLAGTKTLFDISGSNDSPPKLCLVSDAFGSGRGFSVAFSQIPCQ